MSESKLTLALRSSSNREKITEIDQTILLRQKRAEIKRSILKGPPPKTGISLTEEFFDGLDIV